MRTVVDPTAKLTCTDNDKVADAEIDNFKDKVGFNAYLVGNKIYMKYNGKIYVGEKMGLEFTSPGPNVTHYKEGRS